MTRLAESAFGVKQKPSPGGPTRTQTLVMNPAHPHLLLRRLRPLQARVLKNQAKLKVMRVMSPDPEHPGLGPPLRNNVWPTPTMATVPIPSDAA